MNVALMDSVNFNLVGIVIQTFTMLSGAGIVVYKLGRATEKFDAIGQQQAREIAELKDGIKVISEVVTKQALTNMRQDVLEDRLNRTEHMIDDLRRGEGFINAHGV